MKMIQISILGKRLPVYLVSRVKNSFNSASSKLKGRLPAKMFMRVHRSFIVNLQKIDTIERSRIVFGKEYIPVSDQYKEKFQEFIDKNFL